MLAFHNDQSPTTLLGGVLPALAASSCDCQWTKKLALVSLQEGTQYHLQHGPVGFAGIQSQCKLLLDGAADRPLHAPGFAMNRSSQKGMLV